ncbi:hypothetical protein [Citrobacter enshiensis]|uniref:hypothetical protein n=1 Tax=Citrobacter enshiensis TaxID=2971264 RepID=UPI0023E811A8|nr:hypothetical protein [Citrobacter enshiensis]WET42350.1 hypothetical protein P2W74_09680 [Citrobacter enshiensis]
MITPGDLIVADEEGVLVIPRRVEQEVYRSGVGKRRNGKQSSRCHSWWHGCC